MEGLYMESKTQAGQNAITVNVYERLYNNAIEIIAQVLHSRQEEIRKLLH